MTVATALPTGEKLGALLWLDDEVDDFVGARKKLTSRGVQVLSAKTIDEALAILDEADVRICLVDLKLKSDQEGVDFIAAAHARYPQLSFLVYSHYAHLSEPHRRLTSLAEKLKRRLLTIPKDSVPSVTSPTFDQYFTNPILDLLKKKIPSAELIAKFERLDKKQFPEISLTKYLSLPLEQRTEIVEDFRARHETKIQQLFRSGCVWVLFLGEDEKPFRVAKDRKSIPDDSEIGKIAYESRRVPFHFFADAFADDFDSGRCSMESQARGYPTIRIEFKGVAFDTHFDTGLYETRFDYDFCQEVGLIGLASFPGVGLVPSKIREGGRSVKRLHSMFQFSADVSIFRRNTEESFDIKLRGLATMKWEETAFSRECYSDCEYYEMTISGDHTVHRKNGRTCLFRNGLIGRTILEDNAELKIILRHSNTDIDIDSGLLIR